MRFYTIATSLLLSLATSALACAPERTLLKSNTCAELKWVYGPFLNQYNEAIVTLNPLNESDNTTPSKIKIIPWMVMAGHEHGSRPVTQTNISDNEFRVEKIYFMGGMMGTWYLKVQALENNGTLKEEIKIPVEF